SPCGTKRHGSQSCRGSLAVKSTSLGGLLRRRPREIELRPEAEARQQEAGMIGLTQPLRPPRTRPRPADHRANVTTPLKRAFLSSERGPGEASRATTYSVPRQHE